VTQAGTSVREGRVSHGRWYRRWMGQGKRRGPSWLVDAAEPQTIPERLADATLSAVPTGLVTITIGRYPIALCTSCNARWIQDGYEQRAINQVHEGSFMAAGPANRQLTPTGNPGGGRFCAEPRDATDDMAPASGHTATAALPTRPTASSGLRLRLSSALAGVGVLDGGWWPRMWDPDAELPVLIAGLESSFGPIARVALKLDAWDRAPRRVAVDGRGVRVAWFRTMDTHMIGVTRVFQGRLALLVVPPEAAGQAAQRAMATAADAANRARPAEILEAAGIVAGDDA
jgi:Family of unknown function (DUF5994)